MRTVLDITINKKYSLGRDIIKGHPGGRKGGGWAGSRKTRGKEAKRREIELHNLAH